MECIFSCCYLTIWSIWKVQFYLRTVLADNTRKERDAVEKLIRSIIIGLLVAVAIILLKNTFSYKFSEKSNGMQAAIQRKTIDHLFIGSSMFRQGIDIFEAEKGLDGTTFVLSYNGNQPVRC